MPWLLIAAEAREFDGVLRRARKVRALDWPGVRFAREIEWNAGRTLLAANGPGPRLAAQAMARKDGVEGVISAGFCGALDPALRIGDIVVSDGLPETRATGFVRGRIVSIDRVAVSAAEKKQLRETSGASVVEMESAGVAAKAAEWGVPFCCVRTVSDAADESLPLDFNRYRDRDGRFALWRIALAAALRPTSIPRLRQFDANCRIASESLGEFLAACKL